MKVEPGSTVMCPHAKKTLASPTITKTDCGSLEIQQQDYRGELNVTASGRSCARWELQSTYTNDLYPDSGLDGNYCRQPKGALRLAAWCFVHMTDMTWEYYDVPACD
jgi:Kringle domain